MGAGSTERFRVTTATAGGACVGEAHVITVAGEANGKTCAELDRALDAVYDGGGRYVAVDVSELESPDVALDVLMLHRARFRARGGDVVVACGDESSITSDLRAERRIDDAIASLLR
jgi:uncharacterized protein (UPF0261 family)